MSVASYSETENWTDIRASQAVYVDALKLDLISSALDQTARTTHPPRSEAALWRESRTRMNELLVQFEELRRLRSDWDSYGADAPSMRTLWEAKEALERFARTGLLPSKMVPSAEGGVGMIFTRADRYADVEFLNNGEVLAAQYRGDQEPDVWEASDVRATVRRLTDFFSVTEG